MTADEMSRVRIVEDLLLERMDRDWREDPVVGFTLRALPESGGTRLLDLSRELGLMGLVIGATTRLVH
ncbi:MAG: hypothetical protein U0821_24430 [Chloroflexota bacterium]